MGLFSALFPRVPSELEAALNAPLASPWSETDHLATITAESLWGIPHADAPLSRSEAMTLPSVVKARNLIVSSISRLPIHARNAQGRMSRDPLFSGGLSYGLTDQVVLAAIVDDLIFYGRSYARISERLTNGQLSRIEWIERSRIQVTERGAILDGSPVPARDIIRFDSPLPGLLDSGREALRTLRDLERAASEAGYVVPPIVLKQKSGDDLHPEEVRELVATWQNARKKRGGSVGFVNDAIDVEVLDQSREQLLIAAQNWSVLQIARLTGLPAHFLDGAVSGSALNYINQAQKNRELLESLSPFMETITGTFSMFLPYGQTAEFDTQELIMQDRKGRFDEYETALRAGFMTVNEVRALEGLDPLPETKESNDD